MDFNEPCNARRERESMMKTKSLGRRILRAMVALVICLLLAAAAISAFAMKKTSSALASSNQNLIQTIEGKSNDTLTKQSQLRMLELVKGKAEIADKAFFEFQQGVQVAASTAEQIYQNPEQYGPRPVPLPDAEKDGELTIQVLYSASVDPADPAIAEELALIGNVQDVLMSVNRSQANLASIYVATESGFMVQADYIPARKYDEAGNLLPLEAKERPWYQGAAQSGEPYFTPVTKDAHTPRLGIMCGIPVYAEGKLMAVAGGGMYLDDMESLVQSVNLGSSSHACILNRRGQVLFSTFDNGPLAAVPDGEDLRSAGNAALSEMARWAVEGGAGVTRLVLNGVPYYAAFAPMRTVGWSMVVFLSQEEVDSPTNQLLDSIELTTDWALENAKTYSKNANMLLLCLLGVAVVIALVVSVALSNKIVKPIQQLTEEVRSLEGDNLDFTLDLDADGETQLLADSFRSLTQRMKEYIAENAAITAERERISTELSLATKIQSSMLPSIFPPFPNRSEFDIFATMEPAREVGGDFYDFFLVDEDHLCLVIADVSGKGVPAALFMMVSKIILQSCAMLGKSPAEILTRTNDAICANNEEEMFVTAWVGILELSTGKLTAANAGHEYPAIKTPEGRFELLKDKHGFVIGGMSGMRYQQYELQLQPGSKLFLYTDGVPEAMGGESGQEMFGLARMLDALNIEAEASPKELLTQVRRSLEDFVRNAERFDDLTMLCVDYKSKKRPE